MYPRNESPPTPICRVALVAFGEVESHLLAASAQTLAGFDVPAWQTVLRGSNGEIPDFARFAREAAESGVQIVIAAAAEIHLVRRLAAALTGPVIRVPVPRDGSQAAALAALRDEAGSEERESFATVALGEAGAKNAALLAVSILALTDDRLRAAWQAYRDEQTNAVLAQPPPTG
jgi:5-(carboxyamino)imidazole ribonucleotide mutase